MKRIREALAAAVIGAGIAGAVAISSLNGEPPAAPAAVQRQAPVAVAPAAATQPAATTAPAARHTSSASRTAGAAPKKHTSTSSAPTTTSRATASPSRNVAAKQPSSDTDTSYRCTNQIDYAGDPRDNATINSIGAETGKCPAPMR